MGENSEVTFLLSGEIAWFQLIQKYGDRFERPFEHALSLLRRFPEAGSPFRVPPYRKLLLSDTPWGVFYAIEGNRILISAILDLRQDPDQITRALQELLPE